MERVCIGVYYLFFYEDRDEPFFGLRIAGQDTIKIYKVKEPPYKSRKDGFICKANKSYVVCTNGARGGEGRGLIDNGQGMGSCLIIINPRRAL